MNPLFADLPTTIFERMNGLARQHGAINLGQGFPDAPGPEDVRRAAATALLEQSNQYPPMTGLPELREAVAAHYAMHQGLTVSPEQVLVTSGATEALAAAILALVRPGDEVLLVQPTYDAYLPMIRQAGGLPRFVSLRPPDWRLDAVAEAIGPKTRLLILNDPMNPTARAFSAAELAPIAAACVRHDTVALCDEVWEHILFDRRTHHPLIAFPGMAERTVKVGSAGKIFSLTGWKVGWVIAAPALLAAVTRAHQFLAFTTPPNLQWAVAFGLAKPTDTFADMRAGFQRSRDRFAAALSAAGYAVLPSQASYFLCIDLPASGIAEDDRSFCRRLVERHGVAAIPLSAFYAEDAATDVIRLCFAKGDDVLDEAAERMAGALRGGA